MKILQTAQSFFSVIFAVLILSVLASCSSSTDSSSGTGRVSLLITDGPTTDFDQINITLESISLLCEDDGSDDDIDDEARIDASDDELDDSSCSEVALFEETRVINLLALQNYSDLLSTTTIPAGQYSKIRLHVSRVELVRLDINGDVTFTVDAKLPANGKIDLNPRGSFDISDGDYLVIELDIDAEKSIHIVETGSGKFIFRPVIFINVLGDEELKLVIVDGRVFDKTETDFQLCDAVSTGINEDCIAVLISDDTVVQDNQVDEVTFDSLNDNDVVTILGKAGRAGIGALHIVIAAEVEISQSQALFTGEATSVVSGDKFTMKTDDDNDVVLPETALDVTLAVGARIFDERGVVMSSDKIGTGSDVDVFGLALPDLITVDSVKSAFVIYDNDDLDKAVSGTIAAINADESEIIITVIDGAFSGDVCVDVHEAIILLLESAGADGSSEEIATDDLLTGMSVDVYGDDEEDSSCSSADVVLVTALP